MFMRRQVELASVFDFNDLRACQLIALSMGEKLQAELYDPALINAIHERLCSGLRSTKVRVSSLARNPVTVETNLEFAAFVEPTGIVASNDPRLQDMFGLRIISGGYTFFTFNVNRPNISYTPRSSTRATAILPIGNAVWHGLAHTISPKYAAHLLNQHLQ